MGWEKGSRGRAYYVRIRSVRGTKVRTRFPVGEPSLAAEREDIEDREARSFAREDQEARDELMECYRSLMDAAISARLEQLGFWKNGGHWARKSGPPVPLDL